MYKDQSKTRIREAHLLDVNFEQIDYDAITYFVDADESETPVIFKKQTWESVKKGIGKAVSDYLR